MSIYALIIIAGLATALAIAARKAMPAVVLGAATVVLVFAAFPALAGTAAVGATEVGAAVERAAAVDR